MPCDVSARLMQRCGPVPWRRPRHWPAPTWPWPWASGGRECWRAAHSTAWGPPSGHPVRPGTAAGARARAHVEAAAGPRAGEAVAAAEEEEEAAAAAEASFT